jgi:hypothetical protein
VLESSPSMHEVLGLITSIEKIETQ